MLIARHAPQLCEGVRVLTSTALAPMPAFVAAAHVPAAAVARLRAAFTGAATKSWFAELADPLMLEGFAAATRPVFDPALEWDREARAAGYLEPA
jgi:ABC-type phosphate/phosphonate transport system substrate-binding protein